MIHTKPIFTLSLLAIVTLTACNTDLLTRSNTLTREDAKRMILNRPVTGTVAIDTANPYRRPESPNRSDPFLAELQRRGYITFETGTMWDGTVALIGGAKNYVPSFTNRLTDKGRKVFPGSRLELHLTRNIEITGITMPTDGSASVEFTQNWSVEPVDGSVEFAEFLVDHSDIRGLIQFGTPERASAMFRKYDCGWRIAQ